MEQICTFYLDRHLCGVDVTSIQEIVRWQPMTRVPLAPRVIRGLINLRGQIVTAIDLRRRLELPEFHEKQRPTNLLVRTTSGNVSLMVDDVGDVFELDPAQQERPPETLRGAAKELIRAAYKMPDRLLLVLDVERAAAISQPLNSH